MGWFSGIGKAAKSVRRNFGSILRGVREGLSPSRIAAAIKGAEPAVDESVIQSAAKELESAPTLKDALLKAPMSTMIGDDYATETPLGYSSKYNFVVKYSAWDEESKTVKTYYATTQSDSPQTKEKWLSDARYAIANGWGDSHQKAYTVESFELFTPPQTV